MGKGDFGVDKWKPWETNRLDLLEDDSYLMD
jgi:hypothetical protein